MEAIKKEIHIGDYGCVYVQIGVKIKIKHIKVEKVEEAEECFDKNVLTRIIWFNNSY